MSIFNPVIGDKNLHCRCQHCFHGFWLQDIDSAFKCYCQLSHSVIFANGLDNIARCSGVEGKYFDVWSDDEALLKLNPVPNLYVCDGLIIFGNLLFAKSDDDGETIGLSIDDIRLLKKYTQRQFYKLTHFLKYWG